MATLAEFITAVFAIGIAITLTAFSTRYQANTFHPVFAHSRSRDDRGERSRQTSKPGPNQESVVPGTDAAGPKCNPKRNLTIRVDNIPSDDTNITTLTSNLTTIITANLALQNSVVNVRARSLVSRDKLTLCATVSLDSSLSGLVLCSMLYQTRGASTYTFTSQFEGVTPLCVDENGVEVEYVQSNPLLARDIAHNRSIIAVPGLGSHPLGSWRSPVSDDVWLRDFIPKDVPHTRVLIYGYNTTLPGSLSKQSIKDMGTALLEQIIAFRARDEVRPNTHFMKYLWADLQRHPVARLFSLAIASADC